jgi:hypothetical protein
MFSAGRPDILSERFGHFPRFLRADAGILLRETMDVSFNFHPNPWFIILPFDHMTPYCEKAPFSEATATHYNPVYVLFLRAPRRLSVC